MPQQVQTAAISSPTARDGNAIHNPTKPYTSRRGQSLVEFAVVALVLYMLLAAILTFGHALYVAQGLQSAADLAAREISRTPLPATISLDEALKEPIVIAQIYDPDKLVYEIQPNENFFDVIRDWPLLNQQLATLMVVDGPYVRYPGALLTDPNASSGFTVGIPIVETDAENSGETVRFIPVVEEISGSSSTPPFSVESEQRGIVALRINYPFQSASMSSFRVNTSDPFEPTIGSPNHANDADAIANGVYAGTYGGQYGLGEQGAFNQTVRPFRRVISAQAIYRREVFSN